MSLSQANARKRLNQHKKQAKSDKKTSHCRQVDLKLTQGSCSIEV